MDMSPMPPQAPETVFTPGPDNARAFRDALGRFGTGVTVITTLGPDGPVGMTANSFSAVSLDPPLVLWCPAKSSSRYPAFAAARHFAIHVLGDDQVELCRRFTRTGTDFAGLALGTGAGDVPILPGVLARFECELHATHEGGDHTIVVGRVITAAFRDGGPMLFHEGGFGRFTAGL